MRILRFDPAKMYLVASYDISNTKIRNKVVTILESYGFRVQKSVFEIACNRRQYKALKLSLEKILYDGAKLYVNSHENIDTIKFYILSKVGEGDLTGRMDGLGPGYEQVFFPEIVII